MGISKLGCKKTGINFVLEPGGTISGQVQTADKLQGVAHITGVGVNASLIFQSAPGTMGTTRFTGLPLNKPLKLWASGAQGWCGPTQYQLQWWDHPLEIRLMRAQSRCRQKCSRQNRHRLLGLRATFRWHHQRDSQKRQCCRRACGFSSESDALHPGWQHDEYEVSRRHRWAW